MNEIIYRIAEDDDRGDIISLLNKVFKILQKSEQNRTIATWDWKYNNNIFGDTYTIVAQYKDKIVGTGTLWPFQFEIDGKIHLAYQTCGLAVHENFRGQGIFKQINRRRIKIAKENNASFLFSFPNENSLPGYKKMGWNFLGKLQWAVKPLKISNILNDFLFENNKSEIFKIYDDDQMHPFQVNLKSSGLITKRVSLKKNEEYFVWRYCNRPNFKYGFFQLNESDQSAFGAVYTIMKKGDYKEMVIVDIIARDLEMTVLIVKKAVKIAHKYDAMFIAFVKPPYFSNLKLIKLGFLPVKMKNLTVYSIDDEIGETIENINNWSLFAGLHDSI